MTTRFTLRPDPETGAYQPAPIHVRLTTVDASGAEVAVPMEIVSVETSPTGVIEVTPVASAAGPDPVLEFRAQLTAEALADPHLPERTKEPVKVTFVARPQPDRPGAAAPAEIRRQCEVLIEVPAGTIHWLDEDTANSTDQVLHLEADGESQLRLRVWLDQYDPESQRVVYDPEKVEFTHWTGPEVPAEVFTYAPDDRPDQVAGADNNRERTRWMVRVPLPDADHPDLVPPIDTHIRVRAWPRGSISRSPGAIETSPDAKKLGEAHVPIVLEPSKVVCQLVEPTEPIPADGSDDHSLRVRLTRQRTGAAVTSGTYTFELAGGGPGGSLDPTGTTVTLTAEDDGTAELSYTAPELSYRPGGRYAETLIVFRGAGAKRSELGRLPVYLSPSLSAEVEFEKAGLEWETATIEFEPVETPARVTGIVEFEVTNDDPARTLTFPVAFAEIRLEVGDESVAVGPLTTNDQGKFVWDLPELRAGLAKAAPERRETTLEKGWATCEFDDDASTVIDFYDDKVFEYAPFHLFPATLTTTVKSHRLVFGEQVARLKPDLLAKVLAGTEYLRTGAVYGRSWEECFRNQMGTAVDQLANLFSELVGIAVNCANFGEHLAAVATSLARWVEQGTAALVQRMIRWVTTDFAVGIQMLAQTVRGLLDELSTRIVMPAVHAVIESATGAWRVLSDAVDRLLSTDRNLTDLLVGVVDVLANLFKLLVNTAISLILGALELLGRAATALAETVGEYLLPLGDATFRRWEAALREVFHNALQDKGSWGTWGLGKLCELIYGWVLEQLSAMEQGAAWTAQRIRQALDPAPAVISQAVTALESACRSVPGLPTPSDPRIEVFRRATSDAADRVKKWEISSADTEMYVKIFDTMVLCAEIGVAAVGTLFSVGALNPATLGPVFTQIEIGLGVFKTITVHLPLIGCTLSGGALILNAYGLNTLALTSGSTGAAP